MNPHRSANPSRILRHHATSYLDRAPRARCTRHTAIARKDINVILQSPPSNISRYLLEVSAKLWIIMTHQQYIQQAVITIKFEDGDVPFGYVADPTPGELNNKTVDMVDCLVFGEAGVIVRGRDIKTSRGCKNRKGNGFRLCTVAVSHHLRPFQGLLYPCLCRLH